VSRWVVSCCQLAKPQRHAPDALRLTLTDLLDWVGGEFNPDAFSIDRVDQRLAPLQRGWAKTAKRP
jgi:hypothetical protein